ncbi:tetratricopeptide repeat protein [Undibacterium luofuense]|uniref:tetratricopeptide repeat protein n=1 Tax=Undibacterium luofuense TaxID=2828733 RepID=UPI001BAFD793|nr:tetratricopeptide repeat protein [Undibacterium luofuense]
MEPSRPPQSELPEFFLPDSTSPPPKKWLSNRVTNVLYCILFGLIIYAGLQQSKRQASPETFANASAQDLFLAGEDAYFGREHRPQNTGRAIALWELAATKGSLQAARSLAQLYENKELPEQSPGLAIHWYGRAAELGDSRAQRYVGDAFYSGEVAPRDHTKAMKMFRRCATKEAYCKTMWASLLLDNAPDDAAQKKALELLHQADDAGESNAQRMLAMAQLEGSLGMSKNTEKGLDQLFRSGYRDAKSQYLIGQYYEQGKYLRRNDSEAKAWYLKAAQNGHHDAVTALQKLCKSSADKDASCLTWREVQAKLHTS